MSVIFTRSPLRLSLGGGGTDIPSYYRQYGGFLIGGAINKYIYMLTHTAFQHKYKLKYSKFEEVSDPRDIVHPILRESLTNYWSGDPLEIASVADIPAGTGLGSSGAFTVCLLKALALGQRTALTPGVLAERACHVEIDLLGEPCGKQDQYVAAHGGICAYTFNPDDSVDVVPLEITQDTLQKLTDNLLLFYTGETRNASQILSDQDQRTRTSDQEMIENLDRTKEMGIESKSLLENGDLDGFAQLMHEHWQNKRGRSPGMTSSDIDSMYKKAREHGAIGGKLVGAGGGGFLLLYTHAPQHTRAALEQSGTPEVRFNFDYQGCTGTEYH